jgi:hypothetical protein
VWAFIKFLVMVSLVFKIIPATLLCVFFVEEDTDWAPNAILCFSQRIYHLKTNAVVSHF